MNAMWTSVNVFVLNVRNLVTRLFLKKYLKFNCSFKNSKLELVVSLHKYILNQCVRDIKREKTYF